LKVPLNKKEDLCLDANVFVAALCPEEHYHKEAFLLIQEIRKHARMLYEPALVLYEINMALYRKQKQGDLLAGDSQSLLEQFVRLPILFQWAPEFITLTHQLAHQLSFSHIYDVSYLAVAVARDIPLVTFDEELLRKGKKAHSQIFDAHNYYHLLTS